MGGEVFIDSYLVTLNLSHCTASNNAGSVEKGGAYSNKLTAASPFVFTRSGPSLGGFDVGGGSPSGADTPSEGSETTSATIPLYCSISMGDENITTAAFDIGTGEIDIEEVTGPLVIRTWTEGHQ